MDGAAILTFGKAAAFFGIPLGLALWELWRLERDRRRDKGQERDPPRDASP
ncbi:MAG: hypothetical protein AAFZ58_14965 [Pseudomonadota bacterium]